MDTPSARNDRVFLQGVCSALAGMAQVTGGTPEDSAGHTPDISNEDGDDDSVGLPDKHLNGEFAAAPYLLLMAQS